MKGTLIKGLVTELKVQIGFALYGFEVSVPNYNSAPYDLLVDTGKELLKIQVKTARFNNGAIVISCYHQSPTGREKNKRKKYENDEVDYFATAWKNQVYLISLAECSTTKSLRLLPAKNNVNYCMAEDYEIEKVLAGYQKIYSEEELYDEQSNGKLGTGNYCIDCGREINVRAIRCTKCNAKLHRQVERPTREHLKNLIKEKTFVEIGKIYGVTDNAIRKWCKIEGLPFRKKEIKEYSKEDWDLL